MIFLFKNESFIILFFLCVFFVICNDKQLNVMVQLRGWINIFCLNIIGLLKLGLILRKDNFIDIEIFKEIKICCIFYINIV